MTTRVFDSTRCLLGEGPLWHPERGQLYWCDILSRRVLTRTDDTLRAYDLDRFVSCLGWIDDTTLIAATQSDLITLDLDTGKQSHHLPLEQDNDTTRSNDGRADPWGGFWVGTMGIAKEQGAGAIYRVHEGHVTRLIGDLTIPNAICFAPDRRVAYFTDTPTGIVMRWSLDAAGWPEGDPEPWIDETAQGHSPDGAICDAHGRLWISHWGSSRIAVYGADGRFEQEVRLPATQITCPAFGGPKLSTLYATSAAVGLTEPELTANPDHGRTFVTETDARGQPEHRVLL